MSDTKVTLPGSRTPSPEVAARTWEPCTLSWCAGHFASDAEDLHRGTLGQIDVNGSSIEVSVYGPIAGPPLFDLELGTWEVAATEIDNETEDIKEVASQARELMRTWRLTHYPDLV